jgi:hypothetical protein
MIYVLQPYAMLMVAVLIKILLWIIFPLDGERSEGLFVPHAPSTRV